MLKTYFKNEFKALFALIIMINVPYIAIKIGFENKIPTLFYIFLASLVALRFIGQSSSEAELFKIEREKKPNLSKQNLVMALKTKKAHRDWTFVLSFLILIFSFLFV